MGIKNRLLIQMQYDASTNKYPMSFPLPMLLLKIRKDGDELIDLILKCRDTNKEGKFEAIDEVVDKVNKSWSNYSEVIVNMGEYPADADRYEYFEYFLDKTSVPISIMGTYPTINSERALSFNSPIVGNNITILETDFNVVGVYIPDEYLDNYPEVGGKKRAVMKITWGCPQMCSMCPVPAIYGGRYKYHNIDEGVEYIKELYNRGVRFITFTDDNISAADKRFVKFMKGVEKENLKGLKFHSQEGFEVTAFSNEDFCKILVDTNWVSVKLGVENIKEDFLKKIRKYYFDFTMIDTAIKNIKKYNIKGVRFFFLIGLDETEEDVLDNLRYFSKHHVQLRTNILRKYKNTELYDMEYTQKMTSKTMNRLKAMSYAISWLSSYKIDMFDGGAFDKFISENGYTVTDENDKLIVVGRTKFGFQTNRFKLALKYMYENKYPNKTALVDVGDGETTITEEQATTLLDSFK